jgi:hypothetical protein
MDFFRLSVVLCRVIGLWLIVDVAPGLVLWTLEMVRQSFGRDHQTLHASLAHFPGWGTPLVKVVLGVLLILKATRVARIVCRGCFHEGRCQRCGYDLVGAGKSACPECGDTTPPDATLAGR